MGCTCSRSAGGDDIRDYYKVGRLLGSGSFGQVRVCVKRATNEVYAVKIMAKVPPKTNNNVDFAVMFRNEVALLESLNHPNVIRTLEVFEDKHFLYAVMDKCDGGELFAQIVKRRHFTEEDAAKLCSQMLEALSYIHSAEIVHRDIKAENFLIREKMAEGDDADFENCHLVLIDFGMSTKVEPGQTLRQLCGSPHYIAPELFKKQYRLEIDMWALGIVIYLMLYGRYPFEGKSQKIIVQQILNDEPNYFRSNGTSPSALAIDFMRTLLHKDPKKRPTATQAKCHPWLSSARRAELHDYPIGEAVIQAHRKASDDRNMLLMAANFLDRQQEYERRLSALEDQYVRRKSAHLSSPRTSRRLSSGGDFPRGRSGLARGAESAPNRRPAVGEFG